MSLSYCLQGILISRLFNFFGDKEARILVLGLDNAGKTTILCKLGSRDPAYMQQMGGAVVRVPS